MSTAQLLDQATNNHCPSLFQQHYYRAPQPAQALIPEHVCAQIAQSCQQLEKKWVLLINPPHSLSTEYYASLGLNPAQAISLKSSEQPRQEAQAQRALASGNYGMAIIWTDSGISLIHQVPQQTIEATVVNLQ